MPAETTSYRGRMLSRDFTADHHSIAIQNACSGIRSASGVGGWPRSVTPMDRGEHVRRKDPEQHDDEAERGDAIDLRHQQADRAGELEHSGDVDDPDRPGERRRDHGGQIGSQAREVRRAGEHEHDHQARCGPRRARVELMRAMTVTMTSTTSGAMQSNTPLQLWSDSAV